MKFKKNVGFVDQILRALLILDLLIFCVLGLVPDIVASLFLVISAILAVSCVTGHCWFYKSFNISTRQEVNV